VTTVLDDLVAALSDGSVEVVDLTRPLGPDTEVIGLPPEFAPSPGVTTETLSRYDERGPAWYWNAVSFGEHTGTHFDAPIHWVTGKDLPDNATDTIPPARFVGPACVLDATAEVARDPDFLYTVDDLAAWEETHGRVPEGAWVLFRSGWSAREGDAFLNVTEDGPHSPALAGETTRLLVERRRILGLGVETVGTDAGQAGTFAPPFPNHATLHGAGRFGLASLTNLGALPATGAVVIAAPLRLVEGSGSPLRVLALVPR